VEDGRSGQTAGGSSEGRGEERPHISVTDSIGHRYTGQAPSGKEAATPTYTDRRRSGQRGAPNR
jgi:hypothetical protein